jgi:hypothetical protein
MPYALTLHSITVRGAGNDSRKRLAPFWRVHPARLVLSSAFVQAQCLGSEHVICILRILRSYIMCTVRSGTVRWLLAYFLYMPVRLQLLWWPGGLLQVDSLCLANLC